MEAFTMGLASCEHGNSGRTFSSQINLDLPSKHIRDRRSSEESVALVIICYTLKKGTYMEVVA